MSKTSPHTTLHNITQLSLAGEGGWPDLLIENLSPQLNVFYAPPHAGKSSVAQLVGHLLYGQTESSWRRQFGQSVTAAAGSVQLSGPKGQFVLKRQHDSKHQNRLTISSDRGDLVDGQTIQHFLAGLSPQFAAKLFYVDFAESPRADWLLSESFAREYSNSHTTKASPRDVDRLFSCCVPAESSLVDRVDRRRIDELVQRRDTIAGEIEQMMSVRRRESEVLESELSELDSALASKREHTERIRTKIHRLDVEIAELETRLRYYSLGPNSKHDRLHVDDKPQQHELAELDSEITRCRQSLADWQQRENLLRTELAQCGSDGTADSVTCLADGRATLGVLEQLLDDLDAEVSQLARAYEPGRCIGHESHAKLTPVAALLRQQVYTLCGQLTEQERIVRRQQLTAESRQLARVHAELGERLDLLLTRRESLIQRSQLAGQSTRLVPQPPAIEHCRCEHHGEFVQSSDVMGLGRADRGGHESEARAQLGALERERAQLAEELHALLRNLEQLEIRWESLQHERASLIGGASLEEQQAELDRLEAVIRQTLNSNDSQLPLARVGTWRASDILAQLTNGRFVQIRLERHQPQATIIDRNGQPHALESLSAAEHDQLYLALSFSLVGSYAQRGILLPLILDEPFLRLDDAQAAAMAGVLDEFARAGHQLLLFTENREAQRRFSTLGTKLFDLEALRQEKPAYATNPSPSESMPVLQTTNTRIVRETFDGHSTPVLRLNTGEGDAQQDDVFYLTENSSFDEFPVLGSETSQAFSRLSIHTVGDLLTANAEEIAHQIDRESISWETVQLWQIHTSLMCHVPNLTLDDAQILAASGIDSPEDLFDADLDNLLRSIHEFLRSDQGRRFESASERYGQSRLGYWRKGARRYRNRWQRSSRRYSDWRSRSSRRRTGSTRQTSQPRRTERRRTERQRSERQRSERQRSETKYSVKKGTESTTRSSTRTQRNSSRSRRFYLGRQQDVEDAPSIGPKTAARLAKVGIRTVSDLLNADPESTAKELDVSHIKAETLAAWQHQARLVCQIPELRGYGAQLLVACGMTQPEDIARTDSNQLVSQILSFCETKEGQRILRSGDAPEREKIAEWVELAAHSRSLDAA